MAVVIDAGKRFQVQLALVAAVCALIYVFLEPYFINLLRGFALYLSLFLGIVIATLAYEGTQVWVSRHIYGTFAVIKIFPIAMIVAGICVVVSRAIDFHPGLIYGFVGAYTALSIYRGNKQELDKRQRAKTILLGTLVVLIVAAVAFWLRKYVPPLIGSENSFWRYLVYDILTAAFVIGLEGVVFSLIPLFFLDGYKIARWNILAWSAIFGLGGFAFYSIIVRDQQERLQDAVKNPNMLIMIGIMGVSLFVSGIFYLYFWMRRRQLRKLRVVEQPPDLP